MEKNLRQEAGTIEAMIRLYCRERHQGGNDLCPACGDLLRYARDRLDRCLYGKDKPTCSRCPVHCYRPDFRERIRDVMRYAGPRMWRRHPLLALRHGLRKRRKLEAPPVKKEKG